MTDARNPDAAPAQKKRGIPPLVWIVVAVIAIWLASTFIARRGEHVTPQGGTTPMAAEGPSTMPAAPAGPGAPATPAGVANGPNQPTSEH